MATPVRPTRVLRNFPPAQTHAVVREEVATSPEPKGFGRFIFQVVTWPIPLAVVIVAIWLFLGGTTVTATLDNKPVHAQVWIDGKYVADTPYTTRFGFGDFKIEVFPPDGSDADTSQETVWFWSVVRGVNFNADFETIDPNEQ